MPNGAKRSFARDMISMDGMKLTLMLDAEQDPRSRRAIILERSICTRQPTPLKGLEYSQTPTLIKKDLKNYYKSYTMERY